MGKLTDEEWSALESKCAGKRLVRVDLAQVGSLVFRQATKAEYQIFRSLLLDNATTGQAFGDLFLRSVVYPEPSDALKLTEDWAGLTSNPRIVKALNTVNGAALEEEGKG